MTPDELDSLIEDTAAAYRDHLSPSLPNLLKFMGYGTLGQSADGMYLTDIEGNRWLDFLGGLGVFSLGHRHPKVVAGDAAGIPLADRSVDAAWLSTVVHHVPDLTAAARELRRVLRPGGPVLIRSAFAGRHHAITLFRFFPEAIRVLDTYPRVHDVEAAFASAGFTTVSLEQVPQVTAPSLREAAATLRREAHTPLRLITDDEYAAGLARLHRAAATGTGPVVDALDLLVLR